MAGSRYPLKDGRCSPRSAAFRIFIGEFMSNLNRDAVTGLPKNGVDVDPAQVHKVAQRKQAEKRLRMVSKPARVLSWKRPRP